MKLSLPYPVSSNRYWKSFPGPHGSVVVKTSNEAEVYKRSVGWLAKKAGLRSPIPGLIELCVTLHPIKPKTLVAGRDLRSIDLDNCLKVTIDALNGIAYEDDSKIRRILAERGEPVEGGSIEVEIRRYEIARAA
jgi:crossover junction endodeoxyribonuclease RusA